MLQHGNSSLDQGIVVVVVVIVTHVFIVTHFIKRKKKRKNFEEENNNPSLDLKVLRSSSHLPGGGAAFPAHTTTLHAFPLGTLAVGEEEHERCCAEASGLASSWSRETVDAVRTSSTSSFFSIFPPTITSSPSRGNSTQSTKKRKQTRLFFIAHQGKAYMDHQ